MDSATASPRLGPTQVFGEACELPQPAGLHCLAQSDVCTIKSLDIPVASAPLLMPPFEAPGLGAALHHRSAITQAQHILAAAGLYSGAVAHWEVLGRQVIDLHAARCAFDAVGYETAGAASRLQSFLVRLIVQSLTGKYRAQFVFGSGVTESEKQSPRILEGLVAQFVGAVAHLGGLAVAMNELLADAIPSDIAVPLEKDPKTLIQELFQARRWPRPTYRIVGVTGPENLQTFEARVQDSTGNSGSGHGPTKRSAEQNAARQFLEEHHPRVAVDASTRLRLHPDIRRRAGSLATLPNVREARGLTEELGLPSWATPLSALAFIHPSCERIPSGSMGKDYRLLAFLGSQIVGWGIRDHCIRMIDGEELDGSGGLSPVALSALSRDGLLESCQPLFERGLHRVNRMSTKESPVIFIEMLQAFMAVLFLAKEGDVSSFADLVEGVGQMQAHLSSVKKRIKPRDQTFARKTMLQERLQSVGIQLSFQSQYMTDRDTCSIRPVLRMQSPYLPQAMNVRGSIASSPTHHSLPLIQHEEVLAQRVSAMYDDTLGIPSEAGLGPGSLNSSPIVQRWLLDHMLKLAEHALTMPTNKQVVRLLAVQPLGLRHLMGKDFPSLLDWLRKMTVLVSLIDHKATLLRYYALAGQGSGRATSNAALLECLDDVSQWLRQADPLSDHGVAQKDTVFRSVIDHAIAHRIASGAPARLGLADLVDQCRLLFRRDIQVTTQSAPDTTILEKTGAHLAILNLLFEALGECGQDNAVVRLAVEGGCLRVEANLSAPSELLERVAARPLWKALKDLLAVREVKAIDGLTFLVTSVITDPVDALALESWWTVHSGGALNAAADGVVATLLHDMKNELLAYFSAAAQACQSEVLSERYRLAASASRHVERAGVQLGMVRSLLASSVPLDTQRIDLASFFRRVNAETLEWMPVGVHFAASPVRQASYVVSNEEALRSVIVNLIRNAVEAMKDGVGHVGLDYLLDDKQQVLEIEVTDDGPGFSAAQLQALNEGMPVESSKRHGSGIGLLTVLLLAQELGGKVEFRVAVHGGSRVLLSIPINEPEELEPPSLPMDLRSDQEVNVT